MKLFVKQLAWLAATAHAASDNNHLAATNNTSNGTAAAAFDNSSNCKEYTIRADDTCLRIGRATNATYAQLLSWNPKLDAACSNLKGQPDGKLCISNPLGDYAIPINTHGPPTMATTAAPLPSPTAGQSNKICGKWHKVESGEDCSTITNAYGIALMDFLFLNPMVYENCTNLLAQVYYCIEPVGYVSDYPGYGGSTTRAPINPVGATPLPWNGPLLGNLTNDELVIPLANGTRKDCFGYTYFANVTDNYAADCWSLAMLIGTTPEELILWNPSLARNAQQGKTDDLAASPTIDEHDYTYPCTLAANTSYCLVLSSPTPPSTEPSQLERPAPRAAGEITNCTAWTPVHDYTTCASIMAVYYLDMETFYKMNPTVKSDCTGLAVGTFYCVSMWPGGGLDPAVLDDGGDNPNPTTTPGSSTTSHPSTPSPVQTGMVNSCNKFYKVVSDDGCYNIAQAAGINLDGFYSWNPAVKNDCTGLQANVYVCVGVDSAISTMPTTTTTITTTTTTTTSSGSGQATTTPTQDGMVGDCVKSVDGCWAIAHGANIDLGDFTNGGASTSPTPTTTTPGGGSGATPTPTQEGMVDHCKKLYKVKQGDGCYNLAAAENIALDDFYKWNPGRP
ncbi:hypothetical protein G3M48_009881 [Beauveria asiatica]|uniref:LysM domain-containing protein n=1 Tax=Beauveria asiatica TaxID=1069075 RepID=A0AAW0RHY1_9HYPO